MKYYFTDSSGHSRPCMCRDAGIDVDGIRHYIVTPNRTFCDTFIPSLYAFTDLPSPEPFDTTVPDITKISIKSE